MKRSSLLGALALAAAAAVLPARALADTNAQMAAKAVQLFEFAAGVVDANRNDCNAMGNKLSKMAADNQAFIDEVKARAEKVSQDELRALTARYQPRLQAAFAKAKPGLDRCQSNPKVAAVLRTLQQ